MPIFPACLSPAVFLTHTLPIDLHVRKLQRLNR